MEEKTQTICKNLENNEVLLYIMPQRIQKRRLEDMKSSALRKKLNVTSKYCSAVTHIVSEFENLDQVLKCLDIKSVDNKFIVKTTWFVECIKAGQPVTVENHHQIANAAESVKQVTATTDSNIADWACQRSAPLNHLNTKFTVPLEVLEKYAELRDQEQDYSRALAFRRASCVLKSLPYQVTNIECLKHIKDIGNHSLRVIKEILEEGYSEEVQDILSDTWFHKMKLFTSIFGIGPSTSKKWINKSWCDTDDINMEEIGHDWRVIWGVSFYKELIDPVLRIEADVFCDIVRSEAEKVLPGVIVELTGGFRRGKSSGHDVDLLLTHPQLGQEKGLLSALLDRLRNKDLILYGNYERSTFNPEVYQRDFKISMRGQLDHFEKWLGLCKFPKTFKDDKHDVKNVNEDIKEVLSGAGSGEPPTKICRTDSILPKDLCKTKRDWTARRVDLIISPYDQFYYALVGWTGNKHFNRDLRLYSQRVLHKKLTSHGLYDMTTNETIPAASEEEVFTNLNLKIIKPEERNC